MDAAPGGGTAFLFSGSSGDAYIDCSVRWLCCMCESASKFDYLYCSVEDCVRVRSLDSILDRISALHFVCSMLEGVFVYMFDSSWIITIAFPGR